MTDVQPEPIPDADLVQNPEQAPAQVREPELEELKTVTRADVYKNGELAAHLTRAGAGTFEFIYTANWVKNTGSPVQRRCR